MFDIGWTEILVIAVVAIVVVGPKDLPRLLRTVGQMVAKGRRMAGEFQSQFNSALREAEREADLLDAKKEVESLKALNPVSGIKDALNPLKTIGSDIKREIATPMPNPAPAAAAATAAVAVEPAKTGATGETPAPTPVVDVPAPAVVPPAPTITPAPPVAQPEPAPRPAADGQGEAR